MDDEEKSGYRNEFIGYVPQSLGTLPTLSVIDNVRLPYFFKKREGDGIERARMLLDMCGILDLQDDFCKNHLAGPRCRTYQGASWPFQFHLPHAF